MRFVLSLCFLEFSVGVRAFVIWRSQIFSFFSCVFQNQENNDGLPSVSIITGTIDAANSQSIATDTEESSEDTR